MINYRVVLGVLISHFNDNVMTYRLLTGIVGLRPHWKQHTPVKTLVYGT